MTQTGIIRLLLSQVEGLSFERDELWDFTRFTPKQTGLKYDIFLDSNKAYESYRHSMWLYVDCGEGVKYPITISKEPIIEKFVPKNQYHLNEVVSFIKDNYELIENYANRKTAYEFVLACISKSKDLINESSVNIYKSIINGKETGLSTDIWVDENQTYQGHAPRIKFRHNRKTRISRNFPSMEILNPDRIHNLPDDTTLSSKDIEDIKQFVRNNSELLLQLANKKITIEYFKKHMKLSNGKKFEMPVVYEEINGFRIVSLHNKFNFLTKKGQLLLKDYVDEAQPFFKYRDNQLIAYVVVNNKGYYIDDKGKVINL